MPDEQPLTLMAVHAHPDDEASSTGGILARYSAEGVRTVLVTCTDGRCGDGPGGTKPGEAGHDPDAVVEMRRSELEAAVEVLGINVLERLEYHDSGMMGWDTNSAPGAFWGMDVDEAAKPLIELMERYRPQVVVTYDANGFYGHPDHIMAHRITLAAAAATGIPDKVYFPAIPRSSLPAFATALREAGLELPGGSEREEGQFADGDAPVESDAAQAQREDAGEEGGTDDAAEETNQIRVGTPDEEIAARVVVTSYVTQKRDALAAHASQSDNIFFLRLSEELFTRVFGVESFVREFDRTGAATPEDDLFAGVRPTPA